MKILVLVKQVPDTWSERKLDLETGRVDRDASDPIIDEINERALEVALAYKDSNDADVFALAMGPAGAVDTLRKALAMGADEAIHLVDDALAGADYGTTASAIAAAVRSHSFDLIIGGDASTDGRGGVIPAMVAEHLGLPLLTSLDRIDISATTVSGERATEYGTVSVTSELPAVISVTERSAEPRFPNFRGIMKAKKKPLATVSVADLGIDLAGPASVVLSTTARPERGQGTIITDEGDAATQLADYLASQRLI